MTVLALKRLLLICRHSYFMKMVSEANLQAACTSSEANFDYNQRPELPIFEQNLMAPPDKSQWQDSYWQQETYRRQPLHSFLLFIYSYIVLINAPRRLNGMDLLNWQISIGSACDQLFKNKESKTKNKILGNFVLAQKYFSRGNLVVRYCFIVCSWIKCLSLKLFLTRRDQTRRLQAQE